MKNLSLNFLPNQNFPCPRNRPTVFDCTVMTDQSLHEPHHERYRDALLTLGPELFAKVQGTKVLVVGAGGIGCELIKNLVLLGFHDIETVHCSRSLDPHPKKARRALTYVTQIDLDTIDVSNLNRQFLFQKQHIGQSKAQVCSYRLSRGVCS